MRYKCRISDRMGKISEVYKNAVSQQALIKEINDDSLFLISYHVVKSGKKRRFSKRTILDFTETMALMLKSGLSIGDALKVSEGELVETLSNSLMKGISFPEAIEELDSDFPPIYRGLVKIGDKTGSMDDIFQKLTKYLRDEKVMREKIQGALMYPVLVLIVLFLGLTAVFFFIFPRIRKTFVTETLDIVFERFQLMITVILIPLVLIVIFIIFLFLASKSSGKTKFMADRIMLAIPLLGSISTLRSSVNIQ
jgi:type IV pilus assembly protein PilC